MKHCMPDRVIWGSKTHALKFYYSWNTVKRLPYVIGDFTWTFDDKYPGKTVKAEVYTDADEIRWYLNGRELGASKPENGIACFDIPYEKGTLAVVRTKKPGAVTVAVGGYGLQTVWHRSTLYDKNFPSCVT